MCVCVLHLSFILSSIASCFITFMHLYGFLYVSLIILDHLYVSRVKLSSFLYPLSIMTKRGRNCECGFFYKILHVRGRNTFLCKGEMCFILLGGVFTSFFLYLGSCDHCLHTLCLSSLYADVCFFHLPLHVLFLFYLYTHVSLFVCNLLFLFHTRCLDKFCLKCFRNTGCQSLLAMNSLLAKFFKSLC